MSVETFLGNEIIEIYKQIELKYPNGVKYISTKQLNDGNKIRYSISFVPLAEVENTSTKDITYLETRKDDNSAQNFLQTLKEFEGELARIEETTNTNNSKELCIKKIERELIKKGIDEKWLDDTISKLSSTDIKQDKNLILNFILDEMEASFSFANNTQNKPKILIMVGPTGVGKTTFIAKLAVGFKEELRKHEIAFINLDHNRVAAGEQLKKYASIYEIDYADIYEENEFLWQLNEFNDKELIFVDTGGISPFDIKKLLDTVFFINKVSEFKISIALVLSATFKKEDLESMYESFSFLSPDYLIITKFDETANITGLANFLITCTIPMYYFSIGQDIHNDIIPATSEYLREKLLKEWQKIKC